MIVERNLETASKTPIVSASAGSRDVTNWNRSGGTEEYGGHSWGCWWRRGCVSGVGYCVEGYSAGVPCLSERDDVLMFGGWWVALWVVGGGWWVGCVVGDHALCGVLGAVWCGVRCVVCGVWCVVCGVGCVVCGMWCVVHLVEVADRQGMSHYLVDGHGVGPAL